MVCVLIHYIILAGLFQSVVFTLQINQNQRVNDVKPVKNLHFTTDFSNLEIVYQGHYVRLNCYAENFQEVKWFKDGKPYPEWNYLSWMAGWVELRDRNQSLVIARTPYEADGIYKCLLSDDMGVRISREMKLRVMDIPWSGPPLALHGNQCGNTTAPRGGNATFYCVVYVGENNLYASTYWSNMGTNGQWIFIPGRSRLQSITETSSDVVGCTLYISNVTASDYGQYMLTASVSGGAANIILSLNRPSDAACSGSTPPCSKCGAKDDIDAGALNVK